MVEQLPKKVITGSYFPGTSALNHWQRMLARTSFHVDRPVVACVRGMVTLLGIGHAKTMEQHQDGQC